MTKTEAKPAIAAVNEHSPKAPMGCARSSGR